MRGFSYLVMLAAVLSVSSIQAEEAKSWTDRISLNGDFRYRHEGIYTETKDSTGTAHNLPDRNRHRIRLRLGMKAAVNKWVHADVRLATSTPQAADVGDPVSTNQDMSGGFTPKTIWVDRAFVTLKPVKEFNALAGRFGVPFESTDLEFDPDLNLEGIALTYQSLAKSKGASFIPFIRVGGFWAQERATGPDQDLFGAQLGGRLTAGKSSVMLAAAYYDWGNVKHLPTLFNPSKGFGNTTTGTTATAYVWDYNILDVNAQVRWKGDKLDATVLGNFIQNTDPDSENTAWLAGVLLKWKAVKADWDFSYSYRMIERDAVIGAFNDSDFGGGGTNSEGHRFAAGITPITNTRVGLTWFANQRDPDGADLHYERLMADLEVKF